MKKNIVTKFITMVLASAMVLTTAACGSSDEPVKTDGESTQQSSETKVESSTVQDSTTEQAVTEPEEIAYPMDTDVELSIYSLANGLEVMDEYASYEESPFHSGLAERTGLNIEWQFPTKGSDYTQAYNLLWVEEELPSIVMAGNIAVGDAQQLCADGLIWDLTDYLPVYAPDFWAILNSPEYEMVKKLHTADDGRIYSVCTFSDTAYGNPFQGVMVRQDWLEEQSLDAPVTMEDFENVLRVFKEEYDAVLSFAPGRFKVSGFSSGTGCYGGISASYYQLDNEIRFAQTDEQYKEYLTVLNSWYEEGLIDSDAFGNDDNTVRAKVLNDQVGMVLGAQSALLAYIEDAKAEGKDSNWVGIEHPRTAAGEPTTYIPDRKINYRGTACSAVITTACSEEEMIEALKWLNYGFTEEGIYYWGFGEEGVTYNKTADGGIEWTDLINNFELGATEAKKRYTGMSGVGMSIGLQSVTEAALNPKQIEARVAWRENTVSEQYQIPAITFLEDEQETINTYFPAIQAYVDEQSFKFITGEASLDKWEDYVKALEGMGLETVREAYQSAWDRFMAK